MVYAASLDSGWDFWVLALLIALLLPSAMPANSDTRGAKLYGPALLPLAAEGAR
jgi:hypothetical protein